LHSLSGLRLLETRLLVHRSDGWVALPYVWNDRQDEATLTPVGAAFGLRITGPTALEEQSLRYFVPDQNQCAGCHTTDHSSGALLPIGPGARHLNRSITLHSGDDMTPSTTVDQLEHWQAVGYLDGLPEASQRPRAVQWWHTDEPLEQRARAYLDINCGHCHNAAGAADTSGLLLDATTSDLASMGRCKPPIAAGRGTGDRRVSIAPGEPDNSILLFRMQSRDPGIAMPELGRSMVHQQGVELIEEWIRSLGGGCASPTGSRSNGLRSGP
jgi:uncharacterized repeat protein (TIGR03806 family)